MRVRHRIPSIFNLSMVDVLCCALGCVILLWLINLREAKHHEESAEEQNRQISARLDDIRAERDNVIGMMMQMESRIESVQQEKEDLQKNLSAKQGESDDLSLRLKASARRVADLEGDLRERTKEGDGARPGTRRGPHGGAAALERSANHGEPCAHSPGEPQGGEGAVCHGEGAGRRPGEGNRPPQG
jgi:hypothetical protein